MNYWKVIVATAVIFGAGVFTGGLLVNYVHQTYLRAAAPHHPPATNAVVNPPGVAHLPEPLSKPFLPRLDEMLHLSTDQHKAIEKILTDAQGQMHKVTQDTKLAIRAELTPEQRSQYDEAMKRPGKRPAGTNAVVNVPVTNAGPIVLPAHSAATN